MVILETVTSGESLSIATILKDAGIWVAMGYIVGRDIYKDVKAWFMKKAETGKKTAETLTQDSIKETLLSVNNYLKILVEKSSKEISKDQVETILRSFFNDTTARIVGYVLIMYKDNHLTYTEDALSDRLNDLFINLELDLESRLQRFNYKNNDLSTYINDDILIPLKELLIHIMINGKEDKDLCRVHLNIIKKLHEQTNIIINKLISKL